MESSAQEHRLSGQSALGRPSGSVRSMARGSGINLLGAVCNQGTMFLIVAVLALRLGTADVGRYAECYAILTLLGLLSLAGFRAALTRFVAMHLADNDPGRLRGTVQLGMWLTVLGSLAVSVVLATFSSPVARLFHDPSLRPALLLVALALPASTIEDAALSATQGWRSQRAYTLIGRIIDPLVRLVLTAIVISLGGGLIGALWALVVASWLGAGLSCVALSSRMRLVERAPARRSLREIFGFSMISWGSAFATTGLVWADTLLLGHYSTQSNVGIYTIATRLVTLAVFVMTPINNSFTPHMAHLYHVGDMDGVARTYGAANRWIMRLSMPTFVMLLAFPGDLLSYFGHDYRAAAGVTVILAIGQMVNTAVGPCGTVLNMSGHVGISLIDNAAVLAANVALNIVLIPRYGILGAAVAWMVSLTTVNLAKVLQARRVVGIRSAHSGLPQTLTAAGAALVTAFVLTQFIHGWLSAVVFGGIPVLVVFFGVLLVVGVGADDAAMVASAARRIHLPRLAAALRS